MEEKENLIINLTTAFSFKILKYCQTLNQEKHFHISNQLLKSSTSIGANVSEVQNSESLTDFIHKMKMAAKDFFNPAIADGQLNTQRNLLQFTNGSKSQPKVNDILVLDKSRTNSYGHVAIISI